MNAHAATGQALAEMLVVLASLILPLLLLIRLIGGLLYQQQGLELAARYATWERTVWNAAAPSGPGAADTVKADGTLAREVDARILAAPRQAWSADDGTPRLDPFLRVLPGREDSALLLQQDEADDSPFSRIESHRAAPAGTVGAVDAALDVIGSLTRFDLPADGIAEVQVAVRLASLRQALNLDLAWLDALQLRRRSALFAEHWTAGGTAQTAYRISGLLPQQFLDHDIVGNVQQLVAYAPIAEELDDSRLRFGHVTLEPLPSHRLGPMASAP